MKRQPKLEMRACSLPPLSEVPVQESLPLSVKEESLLYKPFISENIDDVFQRCSETDLCSPNSVEVSQARLSKHSPSDCGSAFTDEDSGCHLQYCSRINGAPGKGGPMLRATSVSVLEGRSVQSFNNRDEFITAMTEDLAEWMFQLYPETTQCLNSENFFDRISDGVLLCHHATELHHLLEQDFAVDGDGRLQSVRIGGKQPILPPNPPLFHNRGFSAVNIAGGSFWARDNVANFIQWCRSMRLPDCILFETEDLVSRKNLRSVIVCLLELARLGGRLGMEVPDIIYLEKEIDEELAREAAMNVSMDAGIGTEESPESGCDWSGGIEELKCDVDCPEFYKCDASAGTEDDVAVNLTATSSSNSSQDKLTSSKLPRHNKNTKTAKLKAEKLKAEIEARKKANEEEQEARRRKEEEEAKAAKPRYNRPIVDMRSLDEIVREKLSQCTCEQTFPMVRLSEGRYLFGDKSTQIFIRILRYHVMVRVGGGWDTLDHFLQKYDECRKCQPPVPLPIRHRPDFVKTTSPSSEGDIVDVTTPEKAMNAISDRFSGKQQRGAYQGQGSLQVTKKGHEVVYTTAEVVSPFKSPKCSAPFHHQNSRTPPTSLSNQSEEEKYKNDNEEEELKLIGQEAEETLDVDNSDLDSTTAEDSQKTSTERIVPIIDQVPPPDLFNMDPPTPLMSPNNHRYQRAKATPICNTRAFTQRKLLVRNRGNELNKPLHQNLSSSSTSLNVTTKYAPLTKAASSNLTSNKRAKSVSNLHQPINSQRPSSLKTQDKAGNLVENKRAKSISNLNHSLGSPRQFPSKTPAKPGNFMENNRAKSVSNLLQSPLNAKGNNYRPINAAPLLKTHVMTDKKRAQSVSNLSSIKVVKHTEPDVFKRLNESNNNRRPSEPKTPTPKKSNSELYVKRQTSGVASNRYSIQNKPLEIERKLSATECINHPPMETARRASVARAPVLGTRIPRPSQVLTTASTRSKSVSSQLRLVEWTT